MRYYRQFLNWIGTLGGSKFRIWRYPDIVEHQKGACKNIVTTSTNAGGITVVDTNVLLSQPNVIKAIKTLNDKIVLTNNMKLVSK